MEMKWKTLKMEIFFTYKIMSDKFYMQTIIKLSLSIFYNMFKSFPDALGLSIKKLCDKKTKIKFKTKLTSIV